MVILGWKKNKTCSEKEGGGGGEGDTCQQDLDKTECFLHYLKHYYIFYT